ncbi:MAG: Crp/Fnr family transcriptional regulator [Fimbriimonas sp.]
MEVGMDLKSAIRNSYIAQGLSDEHLKKLYEIAEIRHFESGIPLLEQFEGNRDLFVVIDGEAEILSVTGQAIGRVKPGMPIGEISFIDGKPRSVSVVSVGGCDAVVLPAASLWKVLEENQDLAARAFLNISRVLCARLRSANKNLAALMAVEESEPTPRRF